VIHVKRKVLESILTAEPVVLDRMPLRIDRDEVLRFQGYKKGSDHPTVEVNDLFEQAIREAEQLAVPRAVYRSLSVKEIGEHRIILDDRTNLRIPSIQRF